MNNNMSNAFGELENLRAKEFGKSEMDGTTYFDQDDDAYGNRFDEATGEWYRQKNSGEGEDLEQLSINDNIPNALSQEFGGDDDPAAAYLRQAGFDDFGNEIKSDK